METPVALNIAPLNAPHKNLEWLSLANRDYQMVEGIEKSSRYHIPIIIKIREKHRNGTDILRIWESHLPVYYLPQVNVFPDLIHQCCANYDPNQRVVLSPTGSVLFHITPEAINQMLHFQSAKPLTPLSMQVLLDQGAKLSSSQITRVAQLFMQPNSQPQQPPPFLHTRFNDIGKILVNMIAYILGYNTSEYVDETILVMLSMFTPGRPPTVQYDYATFIADKIHEKFMNLGRERVFKYTSYIYHLILYYQPDRIPIFLKKLDAKEKRRSVIFWTPVFHHIFHSPYNYFEFIDLFIHPALSLLLSSPPPRLTDEMQNILQLSKSYSIGDWYFYKDHTVIRIYGCELAPYKLPKYVPMRLFALEYFRKFGNADMVHFYSGNNKAQLKIKHQLGPFIFNKREEAWEEAHKILKSFQLQTSFYWAPYDPNHFISLKRIKFTLASYDHFSIPHIEKYANQLEWIEGTLVDEYFEEELAQKTVKRLEKVID